MDLCTDIEVMVELWVCWTCGVITVVDVVQIDSTDGPTALPTG